MEKWQKFEFSPSNFSALLSDMLYSLGLLSCQSFPKDNKLVGIPIQEFVSLLPSSIQYVTYFAIMDQGGTQSLFSVTLQQLSVSRGF